jgi:hypothetical protein
MRREQNVPNLIDLPLALPEAATAVFTGLLAITGIAAFVVAAR